MEAEAVQESVPDTMDASLVSDYIPAEPETEQAVGAEAESTNTADAIQPTTDSATALTPAPVPQKYTINGKEYTEQEVAAAFTTAQQFPHLQSKYLQTLEAQKIAQLQAQQPQRPQGVQPQQRGLMPEQLKAMYAPAVKEAVQAGFLEGDLAEAFPSFAANALFVRDQLADVRDAVSTLINRVNTTERGSVEQSVVQEIDSNIASLAGQGEHFAALADPQTRGQFFQYLVECNPQVGQLRNPDFIARMWVGYKKDEYLERAGQANAAIQQQQAARAAQRRNARPDGVGTRPGGPPVASEGWWDGDLLDERFGVQR